MRGSLLEDWWFVGELINCLLLLVLLSQLICKLGTAPSNFPPLSRTSHPTMPGPTSTYMYGSAAPGSSTDPAPAGPAVTPAGGGGMGQGGRGMGRAYYGGASQRGRTPSRYDGNARRGGNRYGSISNCSSI